MNIDRDVPIELLWKMNLHEYVRSAYDTRLDDASYVVDNLIIGLFSHSLQSIERRLRYIRDNSNLPDLMSNLDAEDASELQKRYESLVVRGSSKSDGRRILELLRERPFNMHQFVNPDRTFSTLSYVFENRDAHMLVALVNLGMSISQIESALHRPGYEETLKAARLLISPELLPPHPRVTMERNRRP